MLWNQLASPPVDQLAGGKDPSNPSIAKSSGEGEIEDEGETEAEGDQEGLKEGEELELGLILGE